MLTGVLSKVPPLFCVSLSGSMDSNSSESSAFSTNPETENIPPNLIANLLRPESRSQDLNLNHKTLTLANSIYRLRGFCRADGSWQPRMLCMGREWVGGVRLWCYGHCYC